MTNIHIKEKIQPFSDDFYDNAGRINHIMRATYGRVFETPALTQSQTNLDFHRCVARQAQKLRQLLLKIDFPQQKQT